MCGESIDFGFALHNFSEGGSPAHDSSIVNGDGTELGIANCN